MALLFLEDQDNTFFPNLFLKALVSLKLLFLSPPAGHSNYIISRGPILVLLSIIWREKKNVRIHPDLTVLCVCFREIERERLYLVTCLLHQCHPWVTSPEDTLPQTCLRGSEICVHIYVLCNTDPRESLIPGTLLRASHRLVPLSLTFHQWSNCDCGVWGDPWSCVAEMVTR